MFDWSRFRHALTFLRVFAVILRFLHDSSPSLNLPFVAGPTWGGNGKFHWNKYLANTERNRSLVTALSSSKCPDGAGGCQRAMSTASALRAVTGRAAVKAGVM